MLRGGENNVIQLKLGDDFSPSEFDDLKRYLKDRRNKPIAEPNWQAPLDKMVDRPMPDENNTIQIKGKCPRPFVGCDAISAEKQGKTCPDPRFAVFPYIQEMATGAICYPPLNAAEMARELNEEKKALARQSVMQLIKVLAAFDTEEGTPAMCNIVNKMKNNSVKKAYCEGLVRKNKEGGDPINLCAYEENDHSCAPNDDAVKLFGKAGVNREPSVVSSTGRKGTGEKKLKGKQFELFEIGETTFKVPVNEDTKTIRQQLKTAVESVENDTRLTDNTLQQLLNDSNISKYKVSKSKGSGGSGGGGGGCGGGGGGGGDGVSGLRKLNQLLILIVTKNWIVEVMAVLVMIRRATKDWRVMVVIAVVMMVVFVLSTRIINNLTSHVLGLWRNSFHRMVTLRRAIKGGAFEAAAAAKENSLELLEKLCVFIGMASSPH